MPACVVGDAVGVGGVGVLDGDLHVVEAGVRQLLEALARQQHGRRDQVGVEADLGGALRRSLQVAPHGRLAAGEMQLQDAEVGGLRQHVEPDLGRQLAGDALQRQRVGAVGALQAGSDASARPAGRPARGTLRAAASCASVVAVHAHAFTTPLSARSCSIDTMSARICCLGRIVGRGQLAGDGVDGAVAVAQLQHRDGNRHPGVNTRSGARIVQRAARRIVAQLDVARQARAWSPP